MKKVYAVLNMIVIVAVIIWNYYSNTGAMNGVTVGEMSNRYDDLFTPAGYAFAIWGVIFLGLLVLGINQLRLAFFDGEYSESITQIGPWLIIANAGNALWLWLWLNDFTGWSVVTMLVILASLVIIILNLNMERWDAPLKYIATVWWPICAYSGWIAVATIANISAWLTKIEWSWWLSEEQWTIVMITIAGLLNIFMVITRNMREFAGVGIWALIAIAYRHWDVMPSLQWTAFAWAIVLMIITGIHGYQNRHTNPFKSLLK